MLILPCLISLFAVARCLKCIQERINESKISHGMLVRNSRVCINFTDDVKIIGKKAFFNWNLLEKAILISITEIRSFAFANCTNLKVVKVGKKLETIGDSAFINCHNLVNINFRKKPNSISKYAFCNCSKLETFSFSNQATSIQENPFMNCFDLKFVQIGKNINVIYQFAFYNCVNLICIYFLGDYEPKIDETSFYGVKTNVVITHSSYEKENFWKFNATKTIVPGECSVFMPQGTITSSVFDPPNQEYLQNYLHPNKSNTEDTNYSSDIHLNGSFPKTFFFLLEKEKVQSKINLLAVLIGIFCCIPAVIIGIIGIVVCFHPCRKGFSSFEAEFGDDSESQENLNSESDVLILQDKDL